MYKIVGLVSLEFSVFVSSVKYYYYNNWYELFLKPYVKIEKYVLLEGMATDVLKFVVLAYGELCVVMNTGIIMMLV